MEHALHTLKPSRGSRSAKRRIGRGNASGTGTYSTRGMKGQRARSGGRRGLKLKGAKRIIAALPKIGGFRSLKHKPAVVSLSAISGVFNEGATVTVKDLKKKGLVPLHSRAVKIIDPIVLSKKIHLRGMQASASVKAAIENAGGDITAA